MARRNGGIAPARGLWEPHEIAQAEDTGDCSESREAGCQEDRDGRTGAAGWSGETEDQRDQGGTDGLPEQSRGRLDGPGAAASFARCADDDRPVVWRLEEPEPEAADGHPPGDIGGSGICRQYREQKKAEGQRAQADPAEDSGRIAVSEPAGTLSSIPARTG